MPTNVYLSLGSNVGNRELNLRTAIAQLSELGDVQKVSSFYETEPVEFTEQPWFLNCAVELKTSFSPRQLLQQLLAIEKEMGRVRIRPKGPRLIDLDILLFDELILHEPGLTIPHPALHMRRFVLEPLVEMVPDLTHPVLKKTIRELLALLPVGSPAVRKQVKSV